MQAACANPLPKAHSPHLDLGSLLGSPSNQAVVSRVSWAAVTAELRTGCEWGLGSSQGWMKDPEIQESEDICEDEDGCEEEETARLPAISTSDRM